MRTLITLVHNHLSVHLAAWRKDPDGGYSTETVVVTAVLIVAALLVVGIIVAKSITKAHSINFGN